MGLMLRARQRFEQARIASVGDGKDKLWLEAAAMYEAALEAAPARDEAPEAAMNSAFAYKQTGKFDRAIRIYTRFISAYGDDALLKRLRLGDPSLGLAPDPRKYAERVGFLGDAYDALGTAHFSFFDYQRSAEVYQQIASIERFEAEKRKIAAKNAMILYSSMGQRDRALASYQVLRKLSPTPDEKASADFLVADYDHKKWSGAGGEGDPKLRLAAEAQLVTFYQSYRNRPQSAMYLLEAAHGVARMKRSGGDKDYRTWFKNTVLAWESYRARGPRGRDGKAEALSSPHVDYAAEASYALLDEEIREASSISAAQADRWARALEHIVNTYPSVEWVPVAIARQGSLLDALRHTRKEAELAAADRAMVGRYVTALELARKYKNHHPAIQGAAVRLAHFTDVLGDARMREYVTGTADPVRPTSRLTYGDGQYARGRPGKIQVLPAGLPPPLPIVPW